ncbi:GH1 family beta-glucosidase [Sulfobacillus harzensis]|uniref:Beta-glucosidase n=1 Tax=Sulfobacillus harzensis TaxID=2729629 RepID=A0A7Y0L3Y6_9FIRM|nr:GH1 family beta-glucosidase [Sulfobacillus harzensis]NMP22889.1 beta-glucosidase [Sulfobacillus harzensis]
MTDKLTFPKDFIFGVATSSYQIEGAAFEDGRIPSHWDTFAHTPGKTVQGESGDVACDHYHRYPDDVAMIASLGLDSYRFSFAWPRILTEDRKVNDKGIAFYHRLLDEMEKHGVTPAATIYHWDLPQWLADRGGWANRDSVGYFSDFAEVLFKHFGDRIGTWITHNEPWCASFLSYGMGHHAPGHRDWREAVLASHHLLLSHGEVVKGYRAFNLKGEIGITLNLNVTDPKTDSEADIKAAERGDGFQNRWFLDPIFKGRYPSDMMDVFRPYVQDYGFIKPGDLETIAVPIDFLGVNYYSRAVVYDDPGDSFMGLGNVPVPLDRMTDMGWEVHPNSLYRLLMRLNREYTQIPLFITENGAAYPDVVSEDGHVHDIDRIEFVRSHLEAARQAIAEGSTLKGYYLWSLMDNFEWAFGYSKRFGIVYVDYATQKRILKDSALWYRDFVQNSRV